MAWLKSRAEKIAAPSSEITPQESPMALQALLASIDAESIILSNGDHVQLASPGVETYNLVRDERLLNESLLMLVRAVRRFGKQQEATLELPRGPLGGGTHDLLAVSYTHLTLPTKRIV